MEKMLKKISMELYFFEKNKKITIRQVSDLPVGLKGDVSGLTGNVSGLRGDVSGLTGNVSGLRGDVSGLTGNVSGLTGDVSGLTGNVSGLTGNVSGLTGDVSDLRGDVDACKITTEERNLGLEIKTLILEE